MAAKFEYRINPRKRKHGFAGAYIDGEHWNLAGDDVTIDLPGSKAGAPKKRTYKKATPKIIEKYFEEFDKGNKQTLVTKHERSSNPDTPDK